MKCMNELQLSRGVHLALQLNWIVINMHIEKQYTLELNTDNLERRNRESSPIRTNPFHLNGVSGRTK